MSTRLLSSQVRPSNHTNRHIHAVKLTLPKMPERASFTERPCANMMLEARIPRSDKGGKAESGSILIFEKPLSQREANRMGGGGKEEEAFLRSRGWRRWRDMDGYHGEKRTRISCANAGNGRQSRLPTLLRYHQDREIPRLAMSPLSEVGVICKRYWYWMDS